MKSSAGAVMTALLLTAPVAGRAGSPATVAPVPSSQDVPRIPLRTGLTIVTAVREGDGDYESIKTVIAEDAKSVRFEYSSESATSNDVLEWESAYLHYRPHPSDPDLVIQTVEVPRTVLRSDLKTADHYLRLFPTPPQVPETMPGTTAVGISAKVLNDLKKDGAADLTTYYAILGPMTGADAEGGQTPFPGRMERVERGDVGIPVIVNGKLVALPSVHVKGLMLDVDAEFWFLDDPDNPLALRYAFDKDRLNVIRINFPGDAGTMAGADGAGSAIEQALAKTGHADVYGIYFGFNSEVIRAQSEPVLNEIAVLMAKHPDWKLHVDGHTDNIGGPASNLALSARRAAAVKKALVERYHVTGARLATAGFGLSAPKATNDTFEGRALNRRVELRKE